jgi:hypothetical protein
MARRNPLNTTRGYREGGISSEHEVRSWRIKRSYTRAEVKHQARRVTELNSELYDYYRYQYCKLFHLCKARNKR